jgi:DNA-binding PadR family transcriptional regulator
MLMGGPVHPYEMQRRMKLWGKDLVVNVSQRTGLYKTIERLLQAGLISVVGTERTERFPERTVYALNDEGFRVGREWLKEMLGNPRNEFPRFPAALSFIFALAPDEAATVLEHRALLLREHLRTLEADLRGNGGPLPPRVTLLETEYLRAVTLTELDWLDSIAREIRQGALSWSGEELAAAAQQFLGDAPR